MAIVVIEVLNWDRHQGRKDVKNCSWFKLNHNICEDPDLYGFEHGEFKAWIYILAMCSRKNSQLVTINTLHAHHVSGICENTFHQAVKKLKAIHAIKTRTVRGRYAHGTDPSARQEEIREEERREEKSAEQSVPNVLAVIAPAFEEISGTLASRGVGVKVQHAWLEAFPDGHWIIGEVRKAIAWESANPKRRKKNFGAFMTNWLTRSWDRRRTDAVATVPNAVAIFGEVS